MNEVKKEIINSKSEAPYHFFPIPILLGAIIQYNDNTDLEFVVTVATGGSVKVLSAV